MGIEPLKMVQYTLDKVTVHPLREVNTSVDSVNLHYTRSCVGVEVGTQFTSLIKRFKPLRCIINV